MNWFNLTELAMAHGFATAELDPEVLTCGFIDPKFEVSCTMPAGHADVMHRDLTDPGVLLAWREEPVLSLDLI